MEEPKEKWEDLILNELKTEDGIIEQEIELLKDELNRFEGYYEFLKERAETFRAKAAIVKDPVKAQKLFQKAAKCECAAARSLNEVEYLKDEIARYEGGIL